MTMTILFLYQPIRIQNLWIHNGINVDHIEAKIVKSNGINAELFPAPENIFET